MGQTFEEFRNSIVNHKKKEFQITNSIGVYDVYKMMRKAGWLSIGRPVKEKEFYAIIRGINKYLAEEVAMGRELVFPANMGRLELRKSEVGVSIVKDKLKITYPVDWKETYKLWYEDPEAMRDKVLMRRESPYIYKIRYDSYDATFENKCFYQFKVNSFVKKALSDNIKAGKVDTPWFTPLR